MIVGKLTAPNRDCLLKAKPGEPMFIILGRDPDGGNIVRLWAQRRFDAGDTEHAGPVFAIANAMDAWRAAGNLPESAPDASSYPALLERRALAALKAMTERYVELVNSGDAGNWDPEIEDEVKQARAVLAEENHD